MQVIPELNTSLQCNMMPDEVRLFSTLYLDLYCNCAVKCVCFDFGPDPGIFNLRLPAGYSLCCVI